MLSVPSFIVDLALGEAGDGVVSELDRCAVMVGRRPELNLDKVRDRLGERHAAALEAYWGECRRFWARMRSGTAAGPFVATRRVLVDATQDTGRSKRDLGNELNALLACPAAAPVAELLLDATLAVPALERAVATNGGVLDVPAAPGDPASATLLVSGVGCPPELGGFPSIGEVRRFVTISARHASWRDNRRRRLARVTVRVDEVWPHPNTVPQVRALRGVDVDLTAPTPAHLRWEIAS